MNLGAVAECRPRDSASRVCGDERLRTRARSIRSPKRYAVSPRDRLDVGSVDDGSGGHLVLDS